MCYILFWQEEERGAKMAKKRRKTCEIFANFSPEGNFPVSFSGRERSLMGRLVYFTIDICFSDTYNERQIQGRASRSPAEQAAGLSGFSYSIKIGSLGGYLK